MTKTCIACRESKPAECFQRYANSKDGLHYYCKPCRSLIRRTRYAVNERRNRSDGARRRREWLRDLKGRTPCTDCGRTFPHWLIDFDHLETPDKDAAVWPYVNYHMSWVAMRAQIAKCDAVCVMCHRHRTHCRREGIAWYPLTGSQRPADRPGRPGR